MTVEAYNIKYKQVTKVWNISGVDGIEGLLYYQRQKEQGDIDDRLITQDICPSVLQVEIPDCDTTEIEEIYAYTKSALEDKTKQVVLDFNTRY